MKNTEYSKEYMQAMEGMECWHTQNHRDKCKQCREEWWIPIAVIMGTAIAVAVVAFFIVVFIDMATYLTYDIMRFFK